MTRRALLLLSVSPAAAAGPSRHDQVANAGNRFNLLFLRWAEAFNRTKGTGGIDAGECAIWEELRDQFRALEKLRKDWIRSTEVR